jgi:hypothetical protein
VGNPFWSSGEEEALRGRCSTAVSCQPEEDTGKGAAGGQCRPGDRLGRKPELG